jgi:hypothetical protein
VRAVLILLVVHQRVTVREGTTLDILTTQADVSSLIEQRGEREHLTSGPAEKQYFKKMKNMQISIIKQILSQNGKINQKSVEIYETFHLDITLMR